MKLRISVLAVALAFGFSTAMAHIAIGATRPGEIAQRMVAMESISDAMKVLVATIKGETFFEGKNIAIAGYAIANNLAAARTLFPEGSTSDDSRAKPEIWKDMEGFLAALDKADTAAKMVAAAGLADDENAFKAAFGRLGQGCKGCHEKFRKPKE